MTWCFALGLSSAAGADTPNAAAAPGGASPQAEQRVRQDMQATLSNLGSSGALGQHPDQVAVSLDEPARRVTSLGALVDSTSAQSARDGLHVLGATPGSNADRLGLRPGDVIVAINGTSLRDLGGDQHGRALAATTLKAVVDGLPDDAKLQLAVMRGGSAVTLSGPLEPVYLPAMHVDLGGAVASADVHPAAALASTAPADAAPAEGCGRISMFDVAPRGEHLYGVRILLIDGTTPGPLGTPAFRVSAGEHHLLVAENIPTTQLGAGEFATFRRQTSKPLTVNVKPGTTAMVAAELHPGKATQLNNGGYWDPVVWREVAESCP
ncbi:MAG TPA: PDZ domain-containing protein [Rhodanobacteraceae bacterium]|nr:PDZ domain-containing protein [Rhodanobacteraceae bacterium]